MDKAAGELAVSAAQKNPPAAAAANPVTAPFYYYDSDHAIHYPALESTHKHFLDRRVFHIWACCRCTSRNVNHWSKCGGGFCRHVRCEGDCRWLVINGPGAKQPNVSTGTKVSCSKDGGGRGGGADDVVHLPSPTSEGREDVGVAKFSVEEQTRCWICCCCGKNNNPLHAAACRKPLCGHVRGAHCAKRCQHS